MDKKGTVITVFKILLIQADHGSELNIEIRKDCFRQRESPVLLALAVMDSEDPALKLIS